MKFLLLLTSMVWTTLCLAQSNKDLYLRKIHERCPAAEIDETKTENNLVEFTYSCDGKPYKTRLNLKGEVLFTATEAEIPVKTQKKILEKLDKNYEDWIVDKYTRIEMPDTVFYSAALIKGNLKENACFTLDGKNYKIRHAEKDSWTVKQLAGTGDYPSAPYDFLHPAKAYEMPEILREISGIAIADAHTLFCIQDEEGIIFKYNTREKKVEETIRFAGKGDFEDISLKGDTVYVLRSDGTLFYLDHKNFNGKTQQVRVPVHCPDLEGLTFNPADRFLYLACKAPPDHEYGARRIIYRILPSHPESVQYAFSINISEINKLANSRYPFLNNMKLRFNPSAIAIHPQTGEIYVLSASNKLIAVFDDHGLKKLYPLPKALYYQPEGLAFTPKGDLFLSSEGKKKGHVKGSIFFFPQQK